VTPGSTTGLEEAGSIPVRPSNDHQRTKTIMGYRQIHSLNKFNAKRTTFLGRTYHSKGEASYAMELEFRRVAGEIKEWIPQYKIDLNVNGIHITNYFVDFKVITKNDSIEFHEYKGVSTPDFLIKWNLLHALKDEIEPGCELILIKHKSTFKPQTKWTSRTKSKS